MKLEQQSHAAIYDAAMNGPLWVAALAESVILECIGGLEPHVRHLWDGMTASEAVDMLDELDSAKVMNIVASCVRMPLKLPQEALRAAVIEELMRIEKAKGEGDE